MAKQRRTLADEAVRRAGFRKGGRAAAIALWWLLVDAKQGGPSTVAQYAAHWSKSTAQAYRDWGLWREVFPEWETPSALFAHLGVDLAQAEHVNVGMLRLSV
jgi:hypothetical protein